MAKTVCRIVKFFVLFLIVYHEEIVSERILILSPLSVPSHKNLFEPLVEALVKKGHSITVISNQKITELKNVTQVIPLKLDDFILKFPNPLDKQKKNFKGFFNFDHIIHACHKLFQTPDFYRAMGKQYDLVIVNGFLNECFLGYVYKIQTPFIVLISTPAPSYISETVGNFLPPSFVPITATEFSDKMNFIERCINLGYFIVARLFVKCIMLRDYEHTYRRYLGPDIPGIQEILSNASLILTNSHFSLNHARPTLPVMVEIGGIHCRGAKPLPKELDTFIFEAESGVIYFSLGSLLKSEDLSQNLLSTFLRVFSDLPQRIVWKMDMKAVNYTLQIPSNVRVLKWIPQQDLLGHPNVKLFISHGGLLSIQEAVFHAVPILGIPFGVDQYVNLRKVTDFGSAITMKIFDITEETLGLKIRTILANSTYAERARKHSLIFRDRETTPLDTAIYLIEYVLRHKGAEHLRSGARFMNIVQYYSFDTIISALFCIIFIFWISYAILYLKLLQHVCKTIKNVPLKLYIIVRVLFVCVYKTIKNFLYIIVLLRICTHTNFY